MNSLYVLGLHRFLLLLSSAVSAFERPNLRFYFCNTELNTVLAYSSNSKLGSSEGVESCWIWVFLFGFICLFSCFLL